MGSYVVPEVLLFARMVDPRIVDTRFSLESIHSGRLHIGPTVRQLTRRSDRIVNNSSLIDPRADHFIEGLIQEIDECRELLLGKEPVRPLVPVLGMAGRRLARGACSIRVIAQVDGCHDCAFGRVLRGALS